LRREKGMAAAEGSAPSGRKMTMSVEDRVKFLLRAARRVEAEGDGRVADLFRKMAGEVIQVASPLPGLVVGPSDG